MDNFKNLFEDVHCTLRDKLGIKGMPAMRCIISLFQLKLIEPKIIEYNEKCTNEKKISEICYFKNIIDFTKNNDENALIEHMIPFNQESLQDTVFGILLTHDETKMFFKRDIIDKLKKLRAKRNILGKLLTKLHNEFPESLTSTEYDQFGEAYEDFLNKEMSQGRSLGQYFTPRIAINYMVELLDPDIGHTIYDPTSGTGGFIMALYKFMNDKMIEGKEDECIRQLKNNTFYGGDIDDEIIDLLRFNLYMHGINLDEEMRFIHGNSFLNGYKDKFDYITANPPFGMKKVDFNELKQDLPNYYPIESGKGELLFVQHMYRALKNGGQCAVIVPEGVLNNTPKDYIGLRKLLLEECNLLSITSLPSGIFTNTGIKTSILHFVKGGKTKFVQYKDFKVIDEKKNLYDIEDTIEVNVEKIKNNSYILNPDNYVEVEEVKYKDGVVVRELGDVCEFQNGKSITRNKLIKGEYPVIGGGKSPIGYHNEYNREPNTILCSSSGSAGYISKYDTHVWASDCFSIKSKDENILNEIYLYYHLKSVQDKIYKLQSGAGQPHVYSRDMSKLKIPIPPLEKQKELVEYCDKNNKLIKQLEEEIERTKQLSQQFISSVVSADK